MPSSHPLWINSNSTLASHCLQWLTLERVAIDTEFIRTDTYYPLPGLIQLNTGTQVFLIDPIPITHWQPFFELLQKPAIIKILHSCSEDLEVLQHLTGGTPKPLFDTQLAAAYVGIGYSLSYQKLVKKLLDIELPKDETRSNWRQRPLTASQERYATLDVVHLLQIHSILEKVLERKSVKDWVTEDCDSLKSNISKNDPDNDWKAIKRTWQLRPQQLAVLKALFIFREEQSRKRNLPRNWVVPKSSLWSIARYQPDNLQALAEVQGMKPSIVQKDGENLLSVIQAAAHTPAAQHPKSLPGPLPKRAMEYRKVIKEFIAQQAILLDVPVEILLPSKAITPILHNWINMGQFELPDSLKGWRREVIGKPLIQHLNNLMLIKSSN
ncbi:MAG: ribonuclease D [Candidatus Endonucleobacter bathymodioli]|uniref:Ribonuclease D n=1 Tax=Candidatus Endonucleibacter bathymodioli TaxID=539814 RepID=A0AA90NL35_9GAMM|nr:ribonuclease D [Candidatus Endonucleobacter bathymodioli]